MHKNTRIVIILQTNIDDFLMFEINGCSNILSEILCCIYIKSTCNINLFSPILRYICYLQEVKFKSDNASVTLNHAKKYVVIERTSHIIYHFQSQNEQCELCPYTNNNFQYDGMHCVSFNQMLALNKCQRLSVLIWF